MEGEEVGGGERGLGRVGWAVRGDIWGGRLLGYLLVERDEGNTAFQRWRREELGT